MDNAEIVRSFFDAMAEGDLPGAFERYLAADVLYRNSGLPDQVGRQACVDRVTEVARRIPVVEIELLALAAEGDTVLTERVDHCKDVDGVEVHALPCCGVMRLRDGRVHYWSDYFDPRAYLAEQG